MHVMVLKSGILCQLIFIAAENVGCVFKHNRNLPALVVQWVDLILGQDRLLRRQDIIKILKRLYSNNH